MNEPLWIWPIPTWPMVIHERMEYRIVRIIKLHRPRQEWLLEESKFEVSKRQRPEDRRLDQWISRSNSSTTALHSVCTRVLQNHRYLPGGARHELNSNTRYRVEQNTWYWVRGYQVIMVTRQPTIPDKRSDRVVPPPPVPAKSGD